LFGETAVQLLGGKLDGSMIGGKFEAKAIAVNGDSQTRRTRR
jgi:hypothetical protein